MSIGPLRRFVGVVGLVALVPMLLMVALGELSLVDAATRSGVMIAVLLVLGRFVSWGMGALASEVEATASPGTDGAAGQRHEPVG